MPFKNKQEAYKYLINMRLDVMQVITSANVTQKQKTEAMQKQCNILFKLFCLYNKAKLENN